MGVNRLRETGRVGGIEEQLFRGQNRARRGLRTAGLVTGTDELSLAAEFFFATFL